MLRSCAALVVVGWWTATAAAGVSEPSAREWFNNPVFRIHDTRPVLLFFFRIDDREIRPIIARLNQLTRKGETVVIGLTPDSPDKVRAFIDRNRVRFTVGAGSESAEGFGVKSWPALRRIDRTNDAAVIAVEPETVLSAESEWGAFGEEQTDAITETADMMDFVASDAYGRKRANVVWKLHKTLTPAEFTAFAEAQLAEERNPWVRSSLELLIARAGTGVNDLQEQPARSIDYARAYEQNPQNSEWRLAHEYFSRSRYRSLSERVQDYWDHLKSDPNDVLIRREVVSSLASADDKSMARAALLEFYRAEPDVAIRLATVSTLASVCSVGDIEVADRLARDAALEPNIAHVRPMMEYISFYLRTGEEDARKMPKP